MSVLLIRLAGPMQSWDTQSRFTDRHSGREPSKSGVIGLLCAAMGKPREEKPGDSYPALAELSNLKMGTRVDREGTVAKDYHTAGCGWDREMETRYAHIKLKPVKGRNLGVATADGKSRGPVTSVRYYLADANFLVGLEGHPDLLRRLDAALAAPVWPLFLGRKSFVPGLPVRLPPGDWLPPSRLIDKPLEDALREFPWFPRRNETARDLRVVLECDGPDGSWEVHDDKPVAFVIARRKHDLRHVRMARVSAADAENLRREDPLCISQS